MNKKFLPLVAALLRALGVLVFFIGLLIFLYLYKNPLPEMLKMGASVLGILFIAFGVFFSLFGEMVRVFFSIEDNTQKMAENSGDIKLPPFAKIS